MSAEVMTQRRAERRERIDDPFDRRSQRSLRAAAAKPRLVHHMLHQWFAGIEATILAGNRVEA